VQEAGYLFVGNLLGIPGEAALALAMMARARELTLGVPALIAWQFIEGRLQWRTHARRQTIGASARTGPAAENLAQTKPAEQCEAAPRG
jgi:hypothetical protein